MHRHGSDATLRDGQHAGLWEKAATLRKKFPQVSIGIHWNLTQGRPILLGSRLPTLVDSNGSFFFCLSN